MQWLGRMFGLLVLLAILPGCKSHGDSKSPEDDGEHELVHGFEVSPTTHATIADAGTTPSREDAAVVLTRFAHELEAGDMDAVRADLHIPEGLKDGQVRLFVKELAKGEHISVAGVAVLVGRDFGTLSERFGALAEGVADNADLDLEDAWAFGDAKAAAILHWDGTRFRVAALHEVGRLGEEQGVDAGPAR